ncbi:alpha/beta fold hydrolase [Cupriavidus plantarum]|uniref:alpha/beta fold hydrolase n=2 Tax=Cupriavidus plantarum TaxID=942865 RepID=UPI00339D4BF3
MSQVLSPSSRSAENSPPAATPPRSSAPPRVAGWYRLRWQATSLLHPARAARELERLWFSPPRAPVAAPGQRLLDAARADWALVTGQGASRRVRVYRWGQEGPVVLLAHGWGGNAAQWHTLVPRLLDAGLRVAAFDALSHGASDAGAHGVERSSIVELSRSLLAAAWHVGPVHAVVSHSAGGPATALAIREGLPVRRAALVCPPADMGRACAALAWQLGFSPAVFARMARDSAKWLGMPWSALNVPDIGRKRDVPPTLIVHDRDDREVPWEDGAAIAGAWPGARLATTDGLGHRRILQDAAVAKTIAAFVAG